MISFTTSFSTSFASGLKTQMIKLVQNIMGPEAAGGQTKTAWQGLQHHLPQIPFQKGSMLVSTPWSGREAQDLRVQNQLLSQHLRQCGRQWLLEGSANKHSHGTAKIHCHLANKMSGFASWNIFPSYLRKALLNQVACQTKRNCLLKQSIHSRAQCYRNRASHKKS